MRRRDRFESRGRVCETVVRPAMMYGAETWAVKKAQGRGLDVAEVGMLGWMSGVAGLDGVGSERIRGTAGVGEMSERVREGGLRWYGRVLRGGDGCVGGRVVAMEVPGRRGRGGPMRRWLDSIGNDLSEKELSREDAQDRARWRRLIRHIDPT